MCIHDAIQMDIQGGVAVVAKEDTTAGETITIKVTMATAKEVVMTKVDMGVATAATARYSWLAVTTRTREMIPRTTEQWYHTMEASQQTNSSVLRKGVEDRPEEALAEVRTDKEAEDED